MRHPVQIVAVGARTPLGLGAAPSAAALRAGLSAGGLHPFMIDQAGEAMPAALDAGLDPRQMGPARPVALAEAALREACEPLAESADGRLRLPLYLGLPELRPGFGQGDSDLVQRRVGGIKGLPVVISHVRALPGGHAAGLAAMSAAVDQIGEGKVEACLVGGVDSYFEPDTMDWLDANRQLVGTVARSAFVPGEGAGFCLLMQTDLAARLRLPGLARVQATAIGRETKLIKTSEVCLGEGLTETVRAALGDARLPEEAVDAIICDLNGERYRGEEWGFVCLRLPGHFRDPTGYRSPADGWGDVGAASGPLFAMLACEAAARGYAAGPRTLLWASSENGLRAAVVLTSA